MVRHWVFVAMTALVLAGGCVELRTLLGGDDVAAGGNTSGGSGGGGLEPLGGGDTVPTAELTVTNPVPQVGEEVTLTCDLVGGSGDASYAFQTSFGRLSHVDGASTATFIVDESDIGQELSFTCTATDGAGTSEPSASQIVFPT